MEVDIKLNPVIDSDRLLRNLEKLLLAHAPSGSEQEVDRLFLEFTEGVGNARWQDAAGSIVIHIQGTSSASPVAVTAHKDEIAMIVKRVEGGGRLRVRPVGGLHPWAIGEGPVEILTGSSLVPGVLSIGSKHVSQESPAGTLKEGKALIWESMWVETKLDEDTLRERGVRIGRKVVLSRSRKPSWRLGDDFLCGYNLDCRGGVAVLVEAALFLREHPPARDVYLVASSEEEIGAHGAVNSVGKLPVDTVIALDVVPVAEEYQTRNCGDPILVCKDRLGVYHEGIIDRMETLAERLDFGVQTAVLTSYASDASIAKASGSAARSALIGYPGDNTHGYEICSVSGLVNTARLLLAYLCDAADEPAA